MEWRFHGTVRLGESGSLKAMESGKSWLVIWEAVSARPLASLSGGHCNEVYFCTWGIRSILHQKHVIDVIVRLIHYVTWLSSRVIKPDRLPTNWLRLEISDKNNLYTHMHKGASLSSAISVSGTRYQGRDERLRGQQRQKFAIWWQLTGSLETRACVW